MKKLPIYAFSIACLAALLTFGCVGNKPPTKMEQAMFLIKTNITPIAVETYHLTNELGQVQTIPGITNVIESYDYSTSPITDSITGVATGVGALSGHGELVGLAVGALFGLWGAFRSRKSAKVSAALVNTVETARYILQGTEKGKELDAGFVDWMVEHQSDIGLIKEITKIVGAAKPDIYGAAKVAEQILTEINDSAISGTDKV